MAKCSMFFPSTASLQLSKRTLPEGFLRGHHTLCTLKEKPSALGSSSHGLIRARNSPACARRQHGPKSARNSGTNPLLQWQTRSMVEAVEQQPQFEKEPITAVLEALKLEKRLFDPLGRPSLPSITLRDACRCSQCVDSSTQQRKFSFVDIPANVQAVQEGTSHDGTFTVKWKNDISGFSDHISSFNLNDLLDLAQCASTVSLPGRGDCAAWNQESISEKLLTTSFEAYMAGDKHLLTVIEALQRDGLVFIKGVPSDTNSINNLVERIGPLRNNFYGMTWDVKSKPNAENVAYTNVDLGFHMDLLYIDPPPAFQFLHCLQNTCVGGESRFVDSMRAREIMFADHQHQYEVLEHTKIKYHYHNSGQAYERAWNVFNNDGAVFWSPPFVERFADVPSTPSSAQEALSACKTFASILEREDLVYEKKMEEGTCVIFQNTRVLHARKSFDARYGHRWLRGAYLDMQPLKSTYNRLIRQMSGDN